MLKLVLKGKITVVNKPAPTEYNGALYYKIGVVSDDETANIKCSEEIYTTVERFKEYEAEFLCVEAGDKSSIRLSRILSNATTPAPAKDNNNNK